jgi:hypothetical protein
MKDSECKAPFRDVPSLFELWASKLDNSSLSLDTMQQLHHGDDA